MPEDLGEGLYLASTGMGMVFLTLVIFLLILFALRTLFPGEEVAEIIEAGEPTEVVLIEESQQVSSEPILAIQQQPLAAAVTTPAGSITEPKIAAMAVAIYLSMEQKESAANTAGQPPQNPDGWGIQGRASLWQSQGSRPQPYDQKSHSAYPKGKGGK
jgi:Na+-transporting methylmalonyl-CoA/oxaloacetate decarboxylase gamma subunit